jgi:hypothetical protein
VVADGVAGAVAGEQVVGFFVHHEPTFDRDEVRRHLSVVVLTPTRLTGEQEALLRQLAEMRGEERSDGRLTPVNHGLFGKLRDAFLGK